MSSSYVSSMLRQDHVIENKSFLFRIQQAIKFAEDGTYPLFSKVCFCLFFDEVIIRYM